jgi:hypothetical protein
LGSASCDCSRSSPRRVFHPTSSPHKPTSFIISSSGGSSWSALQARRSTCSVIWSLLKHVSWDSNYTVYIIYYVRCMLVSVFIMIYFI